MINFFEVIAIVFCSMAMAHSYKTHGLKSTILLFGLPFLVGWFMEVLYMWSLHGYFYPANNYALWLPGDFPLAISCGWAVAAYFGLMVMRRFQSFKLGVIAGAGLDVILEPLALNFNLWTWTSSNLFQQEIYFGAPLINVLVWPIFVSGMLLIFSRFEKHTTGNGWKMPTLQASF